VYFYIHSYSILNSVMIKMLKYQHSHSTAVKTC